MKDLNAELSVKEKRIPVGTALLLVLYIVFAVSCVLVMFLA
jgi:hypothetical protein